METTAATQTDAPAAAVEPSSVFSLTEGAIAQIKDVMKTQKLEDHVLTVRVTPAGCSGLGYDLDLSEKSKDGDICWEQGGVRIATDALSAKYLQGTEVDYAKGEHASGFRFNNPNAKSSCGCGSSFSA